MIRIARYSYHELCFKWTRTEYVAQSDDQVRKLFLDILDDESKKPINEFIRPYLLFPWPAEEVLEIASRLAGEMKIELLRHRDDGSRHSVTLRCDGRGISTVLDVLRSPRLPSGLPLLAEVFIYME